MARTTDAPAPPATDAASDASDEMIAAAAPFVASLFDTASDLRDKKSALLEVIDANRSTLRSLGKQGYLNAEQTAALEEWYPTRTRVTAEQNTDTVPVDPAPAPTA